MATTRFERSKQRIFCRFCPESPIDFIISRMKEYKDFCRDKKSTCCHCELKTDGIFGTSQDLTSNGHHAESAAMADNNESSSLPKAVVNEFNNKVFKTEKDIRLMSAAKKVVEVPLIFRKREDYMKIWAPIVDFEEKCQKKMLKDSAMNHAKVRWVKGVGGEQRPKAYFVPKDVDNQLLRMRMGDDLEIRLFDTIEWVKPGRVVQMPSVETDEACIELVDDEGVMTHVTEGYTISQIWNDAIFRRMRAALKRVWRLGEIGS